MKMVRQLVLILALGASPVIAQQQGRELSAAATNSAALRNESRLLAPLIEDIKPSQDVIVRKNVELSGPLIRPFKARKIGEIPKRLWQLLNPFAPSERKEELESTRGLSARAWSSTVGWHPGGSAFSDAVTHEPTMSLISMGKASRD